VCGHFIKAQKQKKAAVPQYAPENFNSSQGGGLWHKIKITLFG
jgi:hypothetical protein